MVRKLGEGVERMIKTYPGRLVFNGKKYNVDVVPFENKKEINWMLGDSYPVAMIMCQHEVKFKFKNARIGIEDILDQKRKSTLRIGNQMMKNCWISRRDFGGEYTLVGEKIETVRG